MPDVASLFLDKSRRLLRTDYLPRIEQCVRVLTAEDVWWRPNEQSNSVGNLLLHLRGNVTQWILGGVAARPITRDRQREFDERGGHAAAELFEALARVVGDADDVLATLQPGTLLESREIQHYRVTVLEAIYHVVEHFGMHTGQIITLTKLRTGRDLALWRPPVDRAGQANGESREPDSPPAT